MWWETHTSDVDGMPTTCTDDRQMRTRSMSHIDGNGGTRSGRISAGGRNGLPLTVPATDHCASRALSLDYYQVMGSLGKPRCSGAHLCLPCNPFSNFTVFSQMFMTRRR